MTYNTKFSIHVFTMLYIILYNIYSSKTFMYIYIHYMKHICINKYISKLLHCSSIIQYIIAYINYTYISNISVICAFSMLYTIFDYIYGIHILIYMSIFVHCLYSLAKLRYLILLLMLLLIVIIYSSIQCIIEVYIHIYNI